VAAISPTHPKPAETGFSPAGRLILALARKLDSPIRIDILTTVYMTIQTAIARRADSMTNRADLIRDNGQGDDMRKTEHELLEEMQQNDADAEVQRLTQEVAELVIEREFYKRIAMQYARDLEASNFLSRRSSQIHR
jgi:hypothetical protein